MHSGFENTVKQWLETHASLELSRVQFTVVLDDSKIYIQDLQYGTEFSETERMVRTRKTLDEIFLLHEQLEALTELPGSSIKVTAEHSAEWNLEFNYRP